MTTSIATLDASAEAEALALVMELQEEGSLWSNWDAARQRQDLRGGLSGQGQVFGVPVIHINLLLARGTFDERVRVKRALLEHWLQEPSTRTFRYMVVRLPAS